MKLLAKSSADRKIKAENDELVDRNIHLRSLEREVVDRLNTVKESYEPDKLAKLKEFELFVKDIGIRKAKLLEEIVALDTLITEKKDLYYGLITKQDALDERLVDIKEQERKLSLREAFVVDLEQRWKAKNQ